MRGKWQRLNRLAKLVLIAFVILGIGAAIPLTVQRMNMESSSNTVEYVFDFRDLIEVAELQPRPQQFLEEKLDLLKEAGITTMSVYESSLKELMQAGRLVYYNDKDIALLQGKLADERTHYTYIVFSGEEEEKLIAPMIKESLTAHDIKYRYWSYEGRPGLVAETPTTDAVLKPLDFDPMAMQLLKDKGFAIMPRPSDKMPYDSKKMDAMLANLKEFGVTRLLFGGEKSPGASEQATKESLDSFGELLKKHEMGLVAIENLKKPQEGIGKLAYLTNYNIVRMYSLSQEDSMEKSGDVIADRFKLAVKDRNIRTFFIHATTKQNAQKTGLMHSTDKMIEIFGGKDGIIAELEQAGYPAGIAQPFDYKVHALDKPLRAVVMLGAVAMIALLLAAFLPFMLIPGFVLGLIGTAGLFVLKSSLLEQGLALGTAVAAPTLGLIWVMNRIYARTTGQRRMVGAESWQSDDKTEFSDSRTKWIFPNQPLGRRIGLAFNWFIVATVISLSAVPLVTGLLNDITYSLVLQQFRGVSLLHLGPIALVAIYVFFYNGNGASGVWTRIRQAAKQPITVLWVIVGAVLAAAAFYYLSRTGNAGKVPAIELIIRTWLENNFGVRPRFKEFMLGHPPLLLGLFLALRYRAAWVLIIVGAMGQLTMVSTFTHIHTPFYISMIRVLLGLGTGIVIGSICIAGWTIVEGACRKWLPKRSVKASE